MAYVEYTELELQALGISGQDTGYLNKKTGCFKQRGWVFLEDRISDDGTLFISSYINRYNTMVYAISIKTINANSEAVYSKYRLNKEV